MKGLKIVFWVLWRIWFYILMIIPIVLMFPFLLLSILTESGYPYIVRALDRGQTLAESTTVFAGQQGDVGIHLVGQALLVRGLGPGEASAVRQAAHGVCPDGGARAGLG